MSKSYNFKKSFDGIYAGRRVLVTGASGFKGSWLAEWLVELGADVTGFALYFPSKPSHFQEIELGDRIRYIKGDVRNLKAVQRVFEQVQPEIVFHLAAQPIVRTSYDDPLQTFHTNLLGTVHVLEAMRHDRSLRAGVFITSDKCYENIEQEPGYLEVDRLGGKDPYSASKACAEIAISSYARSFFGAPGNPFAPRKGVRKIQKSATNAPTALLASARAGNVIGGGDWAKDRIVPDCVRACAAGKAASVRNPASTRPWQHVLEPLSGYLWLGSQLLKGDVRAHGEAFNFGPPPKVNESVGSLINELRRFWPELPPPSIQPDTQAKPEAGLLRLDCSKAARLLKWRPTMSFSETAEFTARWYRQHLAKPGSARELTHTQIHEYSRLAAERNRAWAVR